MVMQKKWTQDGLFAALTLVLCGLVVFYLGKIVFVRFEIELRTTNLQPYLSIVPWAALVVALLTVGIMTLVQKSIVKRRASMTTKLYRVTEVVQLLFLGTLFTCTAGPMVFYLCYFWLWLDERGLGNLSSLIYDGALFLYALVATTGTCSAGAIVCWIFMKFGDSLCLKRRA